MYSEIVNFVDPSHPHGWAPTGAGRILVPHHSPRGIFALPGPAEGGQRFLNTYPNPDAKVECVEIFYK